MLRKQFLFYLIVVIGGGCDIMAIMFHKTRTMNRTNSTAGSKTLKQNLYLPHGFNPQPPPLYPLLYPFVQVQQPVSSTDVAYESSTSGWRPIINVITPIDITTPPAVLRRRMDFDYSDDTETATNGKVEGPVWESVVYGSWKPISPMKPETDNQTAEIQQRTKLMEGLLSGEYMNQTNQNIKQINRNITKELLENTPIRRKDENGPWNYDYTESNEKLFNQNVDKQKTYKKYGRRRIPTTTNKPNENRKVFSSTITADREAFYRNLYDSLQKLRKNTINPKIQKIELTTTTTTTTKKSTMSTTPIIKQEITTNTPYYDDWTPVVSTETPQMPETPQVSNTPESAEIPVSSISPEILKSSESQEIPKVSVSAESAESPSSIEEHTTANNEDLIDQIKIWPTDNEGHNSTHFKEAVTNHNFMGDSIDLPTNNNINIPDEILPQIPKNANITKMGDPFEANGSSEEPLICVPLTFREITHKPNKQNLTTEFMDVEQIYCFPLPPPTPPEIHTSNSSSTNFETTIKINEDANVLAANSASVFAQNENKSIFILVFTWLLGQTFIKQHLI